MKKRKLPKKNCLYISTLYVLRKNQYEKSVFREQLCVPIGCEDVSVKNMEAIPLGSLVSRIYIEQVQVYRLQRSITIVCQYRVYRHGLVSYKES
jgi:hypothetical protein